MCSPGINGEGELRGQQANPGSPGKMAVKTECVCVVNPERGEEREVCVCVQSIPEQVHYGGDGDVLSESNGWRHHTVRPCSPSRSLR